MTTTTITTPVETYKAARKAGKGTAAACQAVLAAYPDVDFDLVVDLSWRIETGKPAPAWVDDFGSQTQACRDWDAGFERKHHGED